MSKTDKTAPWWTQVTVWEPSHSIFCMNGSRACDLPSDPPRCREEAEWFTRKGQWCHWTAANWREVTFARSEAEYFDFRAKPNRSRDKRAWRKAEGVA